MQHNYFDQPILDKQYDYTVQAKIQQNRQLNDMRADDFTHTKEQKKKTLPAEDMNVVVIGHVDAGKSTLIGHLLCQLGIVTEKSLRTFKKEAAQMGKSSFCYAWVMDEGSDERKRGVTIDVCVKHIITPIKKRPVTILDAPGHVDFVPSMLAAAVQADVALLVIDAEMGFWSNEHLKLVVSLGISQLIVAINKMDLVDFDETCFDGVCDKVNDWMESQGLKGPKTHITYVPISAFNGVNVSAPAVEETKEWKTTPMTLMDAIELQPPVNRVTTAKSSNTLAVAVCDAYASSGAVYLAVRVVSGTMLVNDNLVILPGGIFTTCKRITKSDENLKAISAGQYADSVSIDLSDSSVISPGCVLCYKNNPLQTFSRFYAKILVFHIESPLVPGSQVVAYIHTAVRSASIISIFGRIVKKKYKTALIKKAIALGKGDAAIIEIEVQTPVCIVFGPAEEKPSILGRVVLRQHGKTVAAGFAIEKPQNI